MSLFVTAEGGLTILGTVVSILVLAALLGTAAAVAGKKDRKKKMSTKQIVFCAMSIALGTLTSMLKVYEFPFGGSVTLFSMLFVCLPGYLYGAGTGILSAAAYGVLQFILDPYILFPLQILVDYLLAFGALGLAGLFSNAKNGLVKGYLLGIIGRYVFAVISGWIFFGEYAWEGWAPLPYSLAYNGAYIFSEGLITLIILMIPAVSKGLDHVREMAQS